MNDLRERLLVAFQAEHKEHLEGIRFVLAKIEKGGGAAPSTEELDEAFRRAHSLRAAARACDFQTVEALAHRLEAVFSQVRKGRLRPGKEVLEGVKKVLNAIEDWAIGLAEGRNPPEPAHALEFLERVAAGTPEKPKVKPVETDDLGSKLLAAFQVEHKEHLEGIRTILAGIEKGGATPSTVDEAFRRAHSLKGAARLAELHPAEKVAHRLETLFSKVREGGLRLNQEVIRAIQLGLDTIEDGAACLLEKRSPPEPTGALAAIERVLGVPAEEQIVPGAPAAPAETLAPAGRTFHAADTVRVSADNLDRLLRSTGQLLTESMGQNLVTRELAGLNRQINEMEREWDSVRNVAAASLRRLSSTPELAPVARYMDLVEHQVRTLSRRTRAVRLLHQRSSWNLRLLSGQLQQDVRRVRTVSAETVFQGFRKMVRDQARDEGKEVEFRVSGFEIEADRMVLQALKDPLMHMLCNAISHGLESPEERQRLGKNETGRVDLHLETQGNRLRILVQDDGRGIDHRKVAEAAVRRGLLSEGEAAESPPQELVRLIFTPGFSTSRTVTGLSGRGMGLSVVYEAVTRLQGEVDLQPRDGPGTSLQLTVPLSVSTQRLLLVSCKGQKFAVPVHSVEQLMRVPVRDLEMVEGRPMLLLHGQPVPLLGLAHLLDMGEAEVNVEGDLLLLMILHSGPRRVAVAVEAFLEERDALIKDLDEPAAQISKLAGAILLEDGSVCLVINLAELILAAKTTDKAPSLKTAAPAAVKRLPTVLVVDDSLTTRTLEKSILEAHGYQVRIAMDGVEALAQLQAELPDLVITDVQMPRMDGFTLLEEMKKDQRLAQIPVIVVTSMEKREDQERGLALGADAYIVKRKFDHQDLLDTIRQIL